MMVFDEVKHVIVAYKFMTCMSMKFVNIHNVAINNVECYMMTSKIWHVDYFL